MKTIDPLGKRHLCHRLRELDTDRLRVPDGYDRADQFGVIVEHQSFQIAADLAREAGLLELPLEPYEECVELERDFGGELLPERSPRSRGARYRVVKLKRHRFGG